MHIYLLQIDKTQDSYLAEGIEIYAKRLKNYVNFTCHTLNVAKNVRQRSQKEQKAEEGRLVLQFVQNDDVLVVLDERGTSYSSMEFSKWVAKMQNASVKRLVFLIGGPFGFSDEVYARANQKLALSTLTFSHQMVRLFFCEQLYRAFTILKGEKYHHE